LQDEDNVPSTTRQTTRSTSNSITQEAMLSCVDIDPQKTLSKMSELKILMTEFRKMANAVVGDNGELLEYHHLFAN